jgi:hypothetical protein
MESVAILSYAKKDSPVLLYSRSFDHEDDMSFDFFNAEDISNVASSSSSIRSASISSQFRIMCAMDDFDRIEEMKSKSIEKSGDHATGFYLGFLAAMDHFRFYGEFACLYVRSKCAERIRNVSRTRYTFQLIRLCYCKMQDIKRQPMCEL